MGLSNPNISNPIASPANTTTYTLTTSGVNAVQNGDFEQGNTLFATDYLFSTPPDFSTPGKYTVINDPQVWNGPFCSTPNHTVGGNNMLVVDGLTNFQSNNDFWKQTVALTPGQQYLFTAWFYSLDFLNYLPSPNSGMPPLYPIIQLKINGTVVSTTNYPWIGCSANSWIKLEIPYTATASISSLSLSTQTFSGYDGGNDFAVDDISIRCVTTDQVTVSVCNPPSITTQSYFEEGACVPPPAQYIKPIIPNSNNQFCYYWECGGSSHFFSNIPNNNNQWYINDVPITSSGFSPLFGGIDITHPGELIISGFSFSGANDFLKVQVKNTTYGYQDLSSPTYLYHAPFVGPTADNGGQYKANYTHTYNPPMRAGINATYTWSVPGCVVDNLSLSSPDVQITFPASISTTGVTGTLTVSNSICNNGPIQMNFTYNSSLKNNILDGNLTNIFPNPTSNSINIISNSSSIISIEIYDLSGILVKRIKNAPTGRLQIKTSDLKQGFYNCRITTEAGIENQKIIIKR